MNNPDFNLTEFRKVKMFSTETGSALSPKLWIAVAFFLLQKYVEKFVFYFKKVYI
jgi:hypothetical protein